MGVPRFSRWALLWLPLELSLYSLTGMRRRYGALPSLVQDLQCRCPLD